MCSLLSLFLSSSIAYFAQLLFNNRSFIVVFGIKAMVVQAFLFETQRSRSEHRNWIASRAVARYLQCVLPFTMQLQCSKCGDVEFATPFVTCAGQKPSKLASEKLDRSKRGSEGEKERERGWVTQQVSWRSFPSCRQLSGSDRRAELSRISRHNPLITIRVDVRHSNDFVHRHSLARDDAAPGERRAFSYNTSEHNTDCSTHRNVAQIIFFCSLYYFYIYIFLK